ncbi:hypothetical protein OSTOST_10341 [Ostertagia ostertagi]
MRYPAVLRQKFLLKMSKVPTALRSRSGILMVRRIHHRKIMRGIRRLMYQRCAQAIQNRSSTLISS